MADRCPYCGAEIPAGTGACKHHDDLPGLEVLAICTSSPDCTAPVDGHEEDCPVEQELRAVFGF